MDGMIVGEKLLGSLVQKTAINASRFVSAALAQAALSECAFAVQVFQNRKAVIRRISDDHAEKKKEKFYSSIMYH